MNNRRFAAAFALTILASSLGLADTVVDQSVLPDEKYTIRLGGFFVQDINSHLRVDSQGTVNPQNAGRGTEIDLGKNLNVDNSVQVFRGDFSMYLAKRHRLDFTWFNMRLTGRTVLGENIEWGDTLFPNGITVESFIKNNIFRLSYTYFLVQKSNLQLGLSIGAHVMKINSGIKAVDTQLAANEGFTAPLPVFGVVFDYAFSPTWLLRAHAEYFGLSYDKYDGSLTDLFAAIEWRIKPWVGIGGGIEYFDLNITRDGTLTKMELDHKWTGYQAYVSFRF